MLSERARQQWLKPLLEEAGVEGEERQGVVDQIETGLALLTAYERLVEGEDAAYDDAEDHGFRI